MRSSVKLTTRLWLVMACAVAFMLAGNVTWAAHNTITVSVTEATSTNIAGSVQVKNNIAPAQTGALKMIVFAPNPSGRIIQRDAVDLGQVELPAGIGSIVNVPFSINTQPLGLRRGVVKLLADFSSSVGGNPVPHTHCGTMLVVRDE